MPCKAIIQEGKRRGETCQFPPQADGYCGRHKRNKEYDLLIADAKIPCRQYFRGCNNCVEIKGTACVDCRTVLNKKTSSCGHTDCPNKPKENGYCGKHARDIYRDKEKAEGIRYCDITRGCFNLCKQGCASCQACLDKSNTTDKQRYKSVKIANSINSDSTTSLCCYCGTSFEKFQTRYNKYSQSCKHCSSQQKKNDDKRSSRVRNYAVERKKNIARALREYTKRATKKNLEFTLTQEEFTQLVSSHCYYCSAFNEEEVIGIDRVDNIVGYIYPNVAPACWNCNRIKYTYDALFFIEHCKTIYYKYSPSNHGEKWEIYFKRVKRAYNKYKVSSADKRNIEFLLTPDEYEELQDQPCYICGYNRTHVGIDRVDSSKGYTPENTRPCCPPCNYMKGDMSLTDFLKHIAKIVTHPLPPLLQGSPIAAATMHEPAVPYTCLQGPDVSDTSIAIRTVTPPAHRRIH
jgi:hypothetical protein